MIIIDKKEIHAHIILWLKDEEDFYRSIPADRCLEDVDWEPPRSHSHLWLMQLCLDARPLEFMDSDDVITEDQKLRGMDEHYAPLATLHDLFDQFGRCYRIQAELAARVYMRWATLQSDDILRARLQLCTNSGEACNSCVDFGVRCECCGKAVWRDGANVTEVYRTLPSRENCWTI